MNRIGRRTTMAMLLIATLAIIWSLFARKRGGVWLVRWRNHHEGGNYKQAPVGIPTTSMTSPPTGF